MRFLTALTALFAVIALASCAGDHPAYDVDPHARPALWEIDDADGMPHGYLFGTVHLLPKGVDWRSDRLTAAMDRSDALVIEVLGADDARKLAGAFKHLAFSPGLPPVAARLPADLRDELDRAKEGIGMAGLMLNGMESWAAALTLASAQHEKLGLDRAQGVETRLQVRFAAQKKPIHGLESIDEQLGAFDRLPEPEQRRMLKDVVSDTSDVRAEFERLLRAWASGNEDVLTEASQGGMMDAPNIREAVLVARNRIWAARVDAMLKRGETPFVAVGAGHLVGPDNVREMLEAKGYRVKRVQ